MNQVDLASMRDALLSMLTRRSFRYDAAAPFRLASGRQSDVYIDCKPTTMFAEAKPLVGELVLAQTPPDIQAIGGLTMGADPIASAVSLIAQVKYGRTIDEFVVRKEPKAHGLRKTIEGCVKPGMRVAIVDDVVTTGGSTIEAIRQCRVSGLEIMAVVVLVDREEGGIDNIRDEVGSDVPVRAIFTRTELQRHASAHGYVDPSGSRAASG